MNVKLDVNEITTIVDVLSMFGNMVQSDFLSDAYDEYYSEKNDLLSIVNKDSDELEELHNKICDQFNKYHSAFERLKTVYQDSIGFITVKEFDISKLTFTTEAADA